MREEPDRRREADARAEDPFVGDAGKHVEGHSHRGWRDSDQDARQQDPVATTAIEPRAPKLGFEGVVTESSPCLSFVHIDQVAFSFPEIPRADSR